MSSENYFENSFCAHFILQNWLWSEIFHICVQVQARQLRNHNIVLQKEKRDLFELKMKLVITNVKDETSFTVAERILTCLHLHPWLRREFFSCSCSWSWCCKSVSLPLPTTQQRQQDFARFSTVENAFSLDLRRGLLTIRKTFSVSQRWGC